MQGAPSGALGWAWGAGRGCGYTPVLGGTHHCPHILCLGPGYDPVSTWDRQDKQ